ncbi:Glycoprotein-N-acetylgalactosamine 3-beta-galactosyltransferase 1 [Mizuhopecten yessoensis]|uniref:Glycoprotein-N-acetylgalactosamine 3-beta-galactosyltransferase 1 n=1 Tax=Mizuhopecten yessoensis TaxID=6573 RepID=A0A210PX82_MIZYE|nr:Glycoprotein-N-acetylgalactosamine 3-beta-galactosyltransferase 1 [Mizuhopecten yessoensis]
MLTLQRSGFRRYKSAGINFVCGLTIGIFSTLLVASLTSRQSLIGQTTYDVINRHRYENKKDQFPSISVLPDQTNKRFMKKDFLHNADKMIRGFQPINFNDYEFHQDENHVAMDLKKQVRVLCWVMTSPQNLNVKTIHVQRTWAKRCNVVVYISSTSNTSFPTVGLNVSEGRDHLTEKSMQAFKYVYDKHFNDADWFLKADDDTYVILENLRYLLKSHSHEKPVYFGHHFRPLVKQGYHSGGAGYVLSKEALRRLVLKGNDTNLCRKAGANEDVEIGRCMENLGVRIGNSTDALGRTRFHCFSPQTHISGNFPRWFYDYDIFHGKNKGVDKISDYAISFHYIEPMRMYDLEFFIYHLRPYGVTSGHQHLNLPAY